MAERILITGGGGQLGKALSTSRPDAAPFPHEHLDITDPASVWRAFEAISPEVVIHAAAFTSVDAAESQPEMARRVNVEGTRNVARACAAMGSLLVYLSTDYVYPGRKQGPIDEGAETGPLSVYGETKLAGEQVAAEVRENLIVRTSWVFGDGRNFIASMLRLGHELDEVSVVHDQIGRPTYAIDLAHGLLELIDARARGVFHLTGQGEPGSWADVAEHTFSTAGLDTTVRRISTGEFLAGRSGPVAPRPSNSVLSNDKAERFSVRLRPWQTAVDEYLFEKQAVDA